MGSAAARRAIFTMPASAAHTPEMAKARMVCFFTVMPAYQAD